ncbi:hypothetical protein T01_11397 [Trichinella spiralis]|uniref:Uncharacterized protein n=1 Tax=Trichinella spiralis TaxID=6334 RepID=A0A0V0YTF4_TRISP|nr:hypothetical protein T01_11397 [Trichinella spiralis]
MRLVFISLTTLKPWCSQADYYQLEYILMSLVIFAFCACLCTMRR